MNGNVFRSAVNFYPNKLLYLRIEYSQKERNTKYSRTPVTQTRITRTPPLTRTESQFPWI